MCKRGLGSFRVVLTAIHLVPALLGAQPAGSTRSATVADVRYEVVFDSVTADNREIRVQMTFRAASRDPVLLSLPAWTPGAYEISNFARNVLNFTATAEDQPLDWDKLDFDTWRIQPTGAQTVAVSFDYRADTLDNAMAWTRPDFAFFNGTNFFLYPENRPLEFPARVTIRTEADWAVATAMTPAGAPREFTAANYHDLVDMPVFVGRLDVDSARIDGHWFRLATYPRGQLAGEARRSFWNEVRAMMPVMSQVFGETPWATYTTLILFEESHPDLFGLEHQNSHVGIHNPRFIGTPDLASITAHEIFHAWNVKRLRPVEMVPYDYSRPQPTTLLWISEGITDYYADLALVRAGIIPAEQFYERTTGKIQEVAQAPAVALEDASLSTWIDPTDGSRYLYYPQGSLAGLLLDILIRDASDNRASLDHVLRALYHATYRAGQGFTVEQWWPAVSRAAGGRSFAEFAERYVDGRQPFPYAEVFPLAGLGLQSDTTQVPRLGVVAITDDAGVRVTAVSPGSSAADAGVRVGDHLVRVDDVDIVEPAASFAEFRARYQSAPEGSTLTIVVSRDGREQTLTGRLRFADMVTYRLSADPKASPKAVRIRDGILTGRE